MLSRVQCLGISEVRIIDNRYIKRFEGAIIALRGALRGAQKKEVKREGRSTSPDKMFGVVGIQGVVPGVRSQEVRDDSA